MWWDLVGWMVEGNGMAGMAEDRSVGFSGEGVG
jgi:hypothetical protein